MKKIILISVALLISQLTWAMQIARFFPSLYNHRLSDSPHIQHHFKRRFPVMVGFNLLAQLAVQASKSKNFNRSLLPHLIRPSQEDRYRCRTHGDVDDLLQRQRICFYKLLRYIPWDGKKNQEYNPTIPEWQAFSNQTADSFYAHDVLLNGKQKRIIVFENFQPPLPTKTVFYVPFKEDFDQDKEHHEKICAEFDYLQK